MGYGDPVVSALDNLGQTAYRGLSDMGENARDKAALADREFNVNKFIKYDKPVLDQQLAKTKYLNEPASIAALAPKGNSERVHFVDNIARDIPSLWKGAKLNDDLTITKADGSLVPRWEIEKMAPQLQSLFIARTDPFKSLELKNARLMDQLNSVEDPKQRAEIENQIASNQAIFDDPVRMVSIYDKAINDLTARKGAFGGDSKIIDDQISRFSAKRKELFDSISDSEKRKNDLKDAKELYKYQQENKTYPPDNRSEPSGYYVPIQTSDGFQILNARTGQLEAKYNNQGEPLLPISADVNLAAKKEKATKEAAAEVQKKTELFPKARNRFTSLNNKWDMLIGTEEKTGEIDEAIKMVSPFTTGVGAWSKVIPATPAKNLSSKLDTIKANIGFDKLSEMRANSPTGGALGQVSEFENRLLQSVLANLDQDQSPKQLAENLMQVKEAMETARKNLERAYNLDYKEYIGGGKSTGGQEVPKAPQAALEYLKQNPDQIGAFEQKYGYRPEGF